MRRPYVPICAVFHETMVGRHEVAVVFDRTQSVQPERDSAFEKATWGLQATPVFGLAALVLVVVALERLVRHLADRLSPAQNM